MSAIEELKYKPFIRDILGTSNDHLGRSGDFFKCMVRDVFSSPLSLDMQRELVFASPEGSSYSSSSPLRLTQLRQVMRGNSICWKTPFVIDPVQDHALMITYPHTYVTDQRRAIQLASALAARGCLSDELLSDIRNPENTDIHNALYLTILHYVPDLYTFSDWEPHTTKAVLTMPYPTISGSALCRQSVLVDDDHITFSPLRLVPYNFNMPVLSTVANSQRSLKEKMKALTHHARFYLFQPKV